MSRKLFEFFFTPDELEPFYSELTGAKRLPKPRVQAVRKAKPRKPTKQQHAAVNEAQATNTAENNEGQAAKSKYSAAAEEPHSAADRERGQELVEERTQQPELASPANQETRGTQQASGTETSDDGQDSRRTRVRNMLSVHALGQFVFCPRAAILAAERGDQRDLDEPLPRLTFLPNFDLERIEEALSAKLKLLGLAVVLIVALPVSMVLSLRDQTPVYFYLASATLFFALLWAADLLTAVVKLAIRRAIALRAEAREPEPSFSGTESVNWWSLLNAGFEPITYPRPFQHPEYPLEGCPWRVLHKGSLRIPVIRAGGDRLGNDSDRLFPKHEVRLVAYALLLEADGHHRVPYGVVFPPDSPWGLAFSITENHRRQAVKLLADFQQQLNDSQQRNVHPGLPANRNCCANCDYGKPVPTTLREVNSLRKAGEQVVVLQNRSDQLFRCDCADRFGSAPPHRDAVRMQLRVILE